MAALIRAWRLPDFCVVCRSLLPRAGLPCALRSVRGSCLRPGSAGANRKVTSKFGSCRHFLIRSPWRELPGASLWIDWLRRSFSVLALSEPGCRLDMVLGLTGTLAAPRLGASKLGPAPGYRYGLPAFRCPKPAEGSGRQGAWGRNAVFS